MFVICNSAGSRRRSENGILDGTSFSTERRIHGIAMDALIKEAMSHPFSVLGMTSPRPLTG